MIIMTDWRVHAPDSDARIGYETETGVARLAIQLDGLYEGWEFKLDTRREYQDLNVFDFVHDGNVIYFDIVDELGLAAGRYMCQVRGESEGKRHLSNAFCLYVGESIGAISVLENVSVAELYQLEQRLTAIKAKCEELTQASTSAASDATESMRTALTSAEQAVESTRQAEASMEAAQEAAEAAARDAETSTAAAQVAEEAKSAAEAALLSVQAALTAAQTAAESAQADRSATSTARDEATAAANRAQADALTAATAAAEANAKVSMIKNSRFELDDKGSLFWIVEET